MKNIFNKRGNLSSISTIISLSLVLFVVGILALVLINAKQISNQIKEEGILFTIMLNDSTDNTSEKMLSNQRAEFENYLDGSDYFLDFKLIDKEIAYKELQEDMGEDFSSVLDINPLPDSYDARVKAEFLDTAGLKKIEDFIENYKGADVVQSVVYQRNMVKKINSNAKKISLFLLAFCVVFFLISFALINNTIRLSIYSKRLLIRTMRLVGATNIFIQKPYLISSVYQGFFSSVVAIFMLIGSIQLIQSETASMLNINDLQIISIIFILIFVSGFLLSWISTFFAVRKFINQNENELYN